MTINIEGVDISINNENLMHFFNSIKEEFIVSPNKDWLIGREEYRSPSGQLVPAFEKPFRQRWRIRRTHCGTEAGAVRVGKASCSSDVLFNNVSYRLKGRSAMKNNTNENTVSKLLCASALVLAGAVPLSAQACGPDSYLGEICIYAFDYCPQGSVKADNTLLSVQQYTALFSLLGTRFGGDGRSTFGVPDLRGKVPLGTGTSDYGTNTQLGQKGGSASFTLAASNLPQHTHTNSVAQLAAGSVIDGQLSLPVSGGTVSGQTINGSVTVNALSGGTASGGVNTPDSSHNTVGKVSGTTTPFYASISPVAVPSSHNLTVSGGSISGANASGNIKLPANAANLPVAVGANSNVPATAIPTVSPFVGLTACITTQGTYPMKP